MVNLWDFRFLQLAEHIASWSKDPSTKVGAVIVRPNRTIASVGFNGFPRGVLDLPDRLETREIKYMLTVHAEANAILSANEPVQGHTLYVSPLHPCASCAALIVQAGIGRVVAQTQETPDRWSQSFHNASIIFEEAGIPIVVVHPAVPVDVAEALQEARNERD